jgi:two-component system cell cycle sensor histidine kinase/response regulator CckA
MRGENLEPSRPREREARERLTTLLERVGDGAVELDQQGRVVVWSDGAEQLLGWRSSEAIGVELSALAIPESRCSAYARALATCIVRGKASEIEIELSRRDGRSLRGRLLFAVVEDEPLRIAVGLRRLEERRQKKRRSVDEQQLESLGLFAGGLAHDFNNLLLTVIGNATLARRDVPPDSPVFSRLAHIEQAAKKAADLTGQILAFAGRSSFRAERVDLDRLLESSLEDLRPLSGDADVRLELDTRPIPVQADANQLRQLVANLVSNSIEALREPNGRVLVKAGEMDVDPASLRLYYLGENVPEGRYAFIEVVDDGAGMDAATQSHMFEPFFSTKFAGRGLGLSAVLGIVRAHGGTLNVYSEPDRGTRVRVLLPLAGGAKVHPAPTEEERVSQGTVVVADDEEAVRRVASAILEGAGYRVMPAADGREAVELVTRHSGEVKALLLDMTMPTMSGEEAVRVLRELDCPVPVILSSGLLDVDVLERLGAHDPERVRVLQKPFRRAELLEMLRDIAA